MVKKTICFILGSVALVFGMLGILLPVLPTTPFVMLAAICFTVSSPNLYSKLANSRLFGEYIRNWKEHTGVSRKVKRNSIMLLWISLLVSMIIVHRLLIVILLMCVGICVTIHILLLKHGE